MRSEIPNPTPIQQDAYNRHLNKTLDERADKFIKLDAAKDTKGIKNARANWNEATLKAAREAGNEEKREINRARTMQEVNKKKGGKVKARQGALHIPEFKTGTTGHFVQGRGDGQSDDIPAMLADGEYVFDADTVAQLGNGSSKAGAQLLDHFREALRDHKRSAPSDKIPPVASPLQYMKEALKRHKG